MATHKEQDEALSFARRRMVANLIAPTATGSDEGAPRPIKTFTASIVLGAVAVAAVVVLGVLKPQAPSGWQSGLAVDSSSGAAYVWSVQDDELHPVFNITSAKLVLGQTFTKYEVPDDVINGPGITIGAPYGILGAPPDVPPTGNVNTAGLDQWNVCEQSAQAGDQDLPGGSTVVEVGYGDGADQPAGTDQAFLVHTTAAGAEQNYLIDGDYKYLVPTGAAQAMTGSQVTGPTAEGPWVSPAWLSVFAQGGTLTVPSVPDVGAKTTAGQPGTMAGDFGQISGATDTYYIQLSDRLVEVNQFTYTLYYKSLSAQKQTSLRMQLASGNLDGITVQQEQGEATSLGVATPLWPQVWPSVTPYTGSDGNLDVMCASFDGGFDPHGVPRLTLLTGARLPHPLSPNGGVKQSGGAKTGGAYADLVDVASGRAALFQVAPNGGGAGFGTEYLLTDTGLRYPLSAQTETITGPTGTTSQTDAAEQLGYNTIQPFAVPQGMAALIQAGSLLDPKLAGETPAGA